MGCAPTRARKQEWVAHDNLVRLFHASAVHRLIPIGEQPMLTSPCVQRKMSAAPFHSWDQRGEARSTYVEGIVIATHGLLGAGSAATHAD